MDARKLFDLSGKNAIIFGGAGGLGQLVAEAFAQCGAKVAIASRGEEKLRNACAELQKRDGPDHHPCEQPGHE